MTTKRVNAVKKIIAFLLVFAMTVLVFVPLDYVPTAHATTKEELQDEIDKLDEEIEESQQTIEENEKKIDSAEASASDIQEQVDALQTQIDAYNSKIDALNSRITALNEEISETESAMAENESKMATQKEQISITQAALAKRMRAMYMSGNVSNLEILLEADSFTNLLNRIEIVARIAKNDNQIITTLREEISGYQAIQDELETQEASLKADKQDIEDSKSAEQEAKSEIVSSKQLLDQKINTLENYVSNLEEDSAEEEEYIAEARAQQQAYMNQINAQLAGSSSTGTGTSSEGMIWPVADSSSYISSGYGERWGSTHYGIDITCANASSGTVAIIASASGTVKISSNACSHNYAKKSNCGCNGGYGNYVVIDHGNGLLSYYGHMTRSIVSVGATVTQGQVIGYMGCTGYSTGYHLHFEIRVNDGSSRSVAARNPLNYVTAP